MSFQICSVDTVNTIVYDMILKLLKTGLTLHNVRAFSVSLFLIASLASLSDCFTSLGSIQGIESLLGNLFASEHENDSKKR